MEILRADGHLGLPWQARLFLSTVLAGGGVTAAEVAQRFSANTPVVEAHEITCKGGVQVNDGTPGTVVEVFDTARGRLIVTFNVGADRKGSARWPANQLSNGETGAGQGSHYLGVTARVKGLSEANKSVPCNDSTWGITLPDVTGSTPPARTPVSTPVAGTTPRATETPVSTPVAGTTPRATETPVSTPTSGLKTIVDQLINEAKVLITGANELAKEIRPEVEEGQAAEKIEAAQKQISALEASGKGLQEQLDQSRQQQDNLSKVAKVGAGAGVLGVLAAIGVGIWAMRERRRPAAPPAAPPAPAVGGGGGPTGPAAGPDGAPAPVPAAPDGGPVPVAPAPAAGPDGGAAPGSAV